MPLVFGNLARVSGLLLYCVQSILRCERLRSYNSDYGYQVTINFRRLDSITVILLAASLQLCTVTVQYFQFLLGGMLHIGGVDW